jgi:DNA-binding MarR family transcriptional regulator
MSRRARDWVWDNRAFAPRVRLVLLALAEHADAHGESCVASLRQLERMTCLSRREVTKALTALEAAQLIVRGANMGGALRCRRLQMTSAVGEAPQSGPVSAVGSPAPAGVAKPETGSPR